MVRSENLRIALQMHRGSLRATAMLFEVEEGSDDPRAIQGGGGRSEKLYKIIRGSKRRIDFYVAAHKNRYDEELLVRYRP